MEGLNTVGDLIFLTLGLLGVAGLMGSATALMHRGGRAAAIIGAACSVAALLLIITAAVE